MTGWLDPEPPCCRGGDTVLSDASGSLALDDALVGTMGRSLEVGNGSVGLLDTLDWGSPSSWVGARVDA
jgi:hypothetical protein